LKPELASEWSEENEIKPTEVSIGSHKKVIWKCKLGHEWIATVKSRTINRTGCPYCSHNKVLAGFNDLATDFIFVNRFGQPQHQATLNKAIRRIIRNCNDKQFLENDNPEVLLPHFSCHSLRHTFTTRMCEAGVNVKVIQDALGHKDVSTTLNIYTDVTKELRKSEFEGLELQFNQ
jgi:integrase